MSDAPHIFTQPAASWSDRTASPAEPAAGEAADLAAQKAALEAARNRKRLWFAGAAAMAWGVVGLFAGLLWFAAA